MMKIRFVFLLAATLIAALGSSAQQPDSSRARAFRTDSIAAKPAAQDTVAKKKT